MGKTLSLLIIALFITFLGIIAASAQQLKFNAGIEISYHSGQNIGFERKDYGVLRYDYDNLSILTQLRLKYKLLTLISNTTIYEQPDNMFAYTPHLVVFNMKLVAEKGRVKLSVAHTCIHPISAKSSGLRNLEITGGEKMNISVSYNIE